MANRITYENTRFGAGDTIRVYQKIQEGGEVRLQSFEGIVIGIKGRGEDNKTFTVRKISAGKIGVEKIFPFSSPWIEKIDFIKPGVSRRAKLTYLGKKLRLKVSR